MAEKKIRVKIGRQETACFIPVAFDPKPIFGKVRAPVKVTLNGYHFRSTIAAMGGEYFIPLRRSHREAAGLKGDETLEVTIASDTEPRAVALPEELARALKASKTAWDGWQKLSYTHQREWAEAINDARKPQTRARRISQAVDAAIQIAGKKRK